MDTETSWKLRFFLFGFVLTVFLGFYFSLFSCPSQRSSCPSPARQTLLLFISISSGLPVSGLLTSPVKAESICSTRTNCFVLELFRDHYTACLIRQKTELH